MRTRLVLLVVLLCATGSQAGTADAPELTDAAGDQTGPASFDVRAAWFDAGDRSSIESERFLIDVHLQAGPFGATDVASHDVTWASGPLFDPATETSRRGVRFSWVAGLGEWRPLMWNGTLWEVGEPRPLGGDAASGHLVAVGAPSGGGAVPLLRDITVTSHATQHVLPAGPALDTASSQATFIRPGAYRVLDGFKPPTRAMDMVDGRDDDEVRASVDLAGAWIDETDDGTTVTVQTRSLGGTDLLACPWWTLWVFVIETGENGDLMLSSHNSLRVEDGIVTMAFHGADLTWDPWDDAPAEDGPRRSESADGGRVETHFPVTIGFAFGSPGFVQLHIDGFSWNGTDPLQDNYRSLSLSCQGDMGDPQSEQDEITVPSDPLAFIGAPAMPVVSLALAILAVGLRRGLQR